MSFGAGVAILAGYGAELVLGDELTEHASAFPRCAALQLVAKRQRHSATVRVTEALADELLARADIVALPPSASELPEPRFTITDMLALERAPRRRRPSPR